MKKVIVLIFILGLLITPLAGMAEDLQPRVEIKNPKLGTPIRVYMFYDTTAMILCYVTDRGQAMQCWRNAELGVDLQAKIHEMEIVYKKQKGELPSILIIPGK